eukprot:1160444-Pelagomonas_calceolata.AAC.9
MADRNWLCANAAGGRRPQLTVLPAKRHSEDDEMPVSTKALRLINVTSERRMQAAEYSPHQSGNKVAGTEPEQGSSAEAGMQAHPAFTAPASSMQHVTALLQPQQPAPLPRIGPGPMVQGYRHRAIMQLAASVGAANQAQLHQQQQQQLRARLRQAHALHNGQTHAHVVVFFFKLERLAVGGDMWRPSAWPTANLREGAQVSLKDPEFAAAELTGPRFAAAELSGGQRFRQQDFCQPGPAGMPLLCSRVPAQSAEQSCSVYDAQDQERNRKKKLGSKNTPYISQGKGDTLAQGAMSLPHLRARGKLVWVWWVPGSTRLQGTRVVMFFLFSMACLVEGMGSIDSPTHTQEEEWCGE